MTTTKTVTVDIDEVKSALKSAQSELRDLDNEFDSIENALNDARRAAEDVGSSVDTALDELESLESQEVEVDDGLPIITPEALAQMQALLDVLRERTRKAYGA